MQVAGQNGGFVPYELYLNSGNLIYSTRDKTYVTAQGYSDIDKLRADRVSLRF